MTNKYTHYKEKEIHLFKNYDGKRNLIYTGVKYYKIELKQFYEILNRPFKYDFIFVKSKSKTKKEMKKEHMAYILMINILKEKTDNKINMFKTGSFGKTALSLFSSMCNLNPPEVQEYEFKYLNNGGAVRYAKKGYEGIAYQYDINSYYPSLMISNYIRMPLTEGTILPLTQKQFDDKKRVKFGVYHAEIICDNDAMFQTTKHNIYSHYEINYAKQLGLEINILGDALVWEPEQTEKFNKIFGKYVNYLYPIRHKHPDIKTILNALWGALCAKRGGDYTPYIMTYDELATFDKEYDIITPLDDNFERCEVKVKTDIKFYKTGFARMKPFLFGFGRVNMVKTFAKVGYDNVLWSHTDCIISSIPLTNKHITQSFQIGKWKYEGKDPNCYIYNKNLKDFKKPKNIKRPYCNIFED